MYEKTARINTRMTPERWRQSEQLYDAVVNLPAAERSLRLQDADPELRSAIEAILAQNGSALEHPAWERHTNLLEHAAWEDRAVLSQTRTNVPGIDDATITEPAPGALIGWYQSEASLSPQSRQSQDGLA